MERNTFIGQTVGQKITNGHGILCEPVCMYGTCNFIA